MELSVSEVFLLSVLFAVPQILIFLVRQRVPGAGDRVPLME